MKVFALVAALLFISCANAHNGQKCLEGGKHKAAPSAESGNFTACSAYKNKSCCAAEFTKQLASPVTRIGNFSWTPCGNLTKRCEAFMVKVECFYRCSPNAAFWSKPTVANAFSKAPLCSDFCDSWFDACKDDLTCAKNWLADFNFATSPSSCKANTTCDKMSAVYTNAEGLCNNIWGESFVYKKSQKANDCLKLDFTGPTNPNDAVVDTYFGNTTARTTLPPEGTTPSSAVAVQGALATVLAALVAFFLF